jgi:hypothetical protein
MGCTLDPPAATVAPGSVIDAWTGVPRSNLTFGSPSKRRIGNYPSFVPNEPGKTGRGPSCYQGARGHDGRGPEQLPTCRSRSHSRPHLMLKPSAGAALRGR